MHGDITDQDPITAEAHRIGTLKRKGALRRAVDDFHRRHDGLYASIARTSMHRHRGLISPSIDEDDFTQIVRMVSNGLLTEVDWSAQGINYMAVLTRRSRHAIRQFLQSSDNHGYSGASASQKRAQRASALRPILTEQLGREPTDSELVAAVNQDNKVRLTHHTKAGKATEADLRLPKSVLLDPITPLGSQPLLPGASEMDRGDIEPFVRKVIAAAWEEEEILGEFAERWLEPWVEDIDIAEVPDLAVLAKEMGRGTDWARKRAHQVKRLCREVLIRDYGIRLT